MIKKCSKGFEEIELKLEKKNREIELRKEKYEEFDNPTIAFSMSGIISLLKIRLITFENIVQSTLKNKERDKYIIENTLGILEEKEDERKESIFEKSRNSININDLLNERVDNLEDQLKIAHAVINNIIEKKNFSNDIIFYLEYGPRFDLEVSFHKYREYDKEIVEDIVNKDYLAAYYIMEETDESIVSSMDS